jgi:Trk K+ transport system NAD-binding subunit
VQSDMAPGIVEQIVTTLADLKTQVFGTTRSKTIIVGTNPLTRLLTRDLENAGESVSLIDLDDGAALDGKAQDHLVLSSAGAKAASCVLAATANDAWNLNFCRTARTRFHVPMVIARLGLLGGVMSWARLNDAGMVKLSWNEMVSAVLGTASPGSGLARMAQLTDREQVAEVELLIPVFLGRTIADLPLDGCDVIALRRNELWVDEIEVTELSRGDVLTLVGTRSSITKVRECLASL